MEIFNFVVDLDPQKLTNWGFRYFICFFHLVCSNKDTEQMTKGIEYICKVIRTKKKGIERIAIASLWMIYSKNSLESDVRREWNRELI